jgi:hypothetical protein
MYRSFGASSCSKSVTLCYAVRPETYVSLKLNEFTLEISPVNKQLKNPNQKSNAKEKWQKTIKL